MLTGFNRRDLLVLMLLAALSLGAGWHAYGESHRNEERDWRSQLQQRLQQWFPQEMSLSDGQYGFRADSAESEPQLVLLHGLDEPGGIWDELLPALRDKGLVAWPFRYPNDQAIELSADFLADAWRTLPSDADVVLVGHSMGGLVIRDFVTRHYQPGMARVRGVILVGTPNHGSEWARLRIWLELREQLANLQRGEFSPMAALREGTGAAKIDLRPQSEFLKSLNARPWPDSVPVRIVGGVVVEPSADMASSLRAFEQELGVESAAIIDGLLDWWRDIGDNLGDGVVSVESLALPYAPAPLLLQASHRGLLISSDPASSAPAITPIMGWLDDWDVTARD